MIIGVIADTHGLVRTEVVDQFRGVSLIIPAGDIGIPDVLTALRAVTPVWAVRGNVDEGAWAESLSEAEVVECNGSYIYLSRWFLEIPGLSVCQRVNGPNPFDQFRVTRRECL